MKITRLIAALAIGVTVTSAAQCTLETSHEAPDSVTRDYIEIIQQIGRTIQPWISLAMKTPEGLGMQKRQTNEEQPWNV